MKKRPLVVTACVRLMVAIGLAPTIAIAGRGHGGRGGGGVVSSSRPFRFQHHGFGHGPDAVPTKYRTEAKHAPRP